MNRKAGEILIFGFVAAALFCVFRAESFAQVKKDVSDPVLNEILAFFNHRMPRFINQHGQDVFVADGPVTRGGLISALYEYDRSLKFAPKQEVSELKEKMAAIEKTGKTYDINGIIAELQPSMPVMLDKSLNNSKVFLNLKSEMAKKQGAEPQMEQGKTASESLAELTKRVAKLEEVPVAAQSAESAELGELKDRLSALENKISNEKMAEASKKSPSVDIEDLSKRIENLEAVQAQNSALLKKAPENYSVLSDKIDKLQANETELKDIRKNLSILEARIGSAENLSPSASVSLNEQLNLLNKKIDKIERSVPASQAPASDLSQLEKRLDRIERSSAAKAPTSGEPKKQEKNQTDQNRALEEKIARIEDRLNNLESSGVLPAVQAPSGTTELADLYKRLDRVEKAVSDYQEIERHITKIEEHINSVERVSSLGNVSSSEELADMAKRVSELERAQGQNK